MDWFDAHNLARLQFAFTVSFHFIFPSFSIGLASYLAVLNVGHLYTGKAVYLTLFNYWKKIFAVAFGMGVVSGLVMSYQFGTNWSVFSDKAGPVIGPLMGYEVLTAFFLEAGFLGVMLFGRERVGPKLHCFASLLVAFGTALSAFWILSVNSWMQTPAGYSMNAAGQYIVEDWFAVIFNPSFPYRLVHTVFAAYLTTALVVGAVGAYHLLKFRKHPPTEANGRDSLQASRTMFSMAMWLIAIVAPLQILAGDMHGLNDVEYQPKKIAVMEGHYETVTPAPLVLFGIPDAKEKKLHYKVEIPYLGSLILTHKLDGVIQGLNTWPDNEVPPMALPFFAFRIMVGLGMLMLALAVFGLWQRFKNKLYDSPFLHQFAVVMGPAGFIAVVAGWIVTEVGRQPYTIYNLLTTWDSRSPVDAAAVGASLLAFIIVYFVLFSMGIYYILVMMRRAPQSDDVHLPLTEPVRAAGVGAGRTISTLIKEA